MEITLRRAAQIRNEAENRIKELALGTSMQHSIKLQLGKRVTEAREKFEKNMADARALDAVVYELRLEVGQANAKSGISDIMAEREHFIRKRDRLALVATATPFDEERSRAQMSVLQIKLEKAENSYGSDELHVDFITQEEIDAAKASLAAVKQAIIKLDDRLQELNHTTKISLSGLTVSTLARFNLV